MSRTLGWILALTGPVLLIVILYSAHLVGLGLYSERAHTRLHTIFISRPLDPSRLSEIEVASLVEPLKGTKQYSSAEQLLILGSTLERGAYDEFRKQLPRPDLRLQKGTVEHWSTLAGHLIAVSSAPPTASDPEDEVKFILAKLRSEIADELTRRLTPPLSNFERDYYDTVRSISGAAGYPLPELPPSTNFEMSMLSSSGLSGVLC